MLNSGQELNSNNPSGINCMKAKNFSHFCNYATAQA